MTLSLVGNGGLSCSGSVVGIGIERRNNPHTLENNNSLGGLENKDDPAADRIRYHDSDISVMLQW